MQCFFPQELKFYVRNVWDDPRLWTVSGFEHEFLAAYKWLNPHISGMKHFCHNKGLFEGQEPAHLFWMYNLWLCSIFSIFSILHTLDVFFSLLWAAFCALGNLFYSHCKRMPAFWVKCLKYIISYSCVVFRSWPGLRRGRKRSQPLWNLL